MEDQPYLRTYVGRQSLESYRRQAISDGRVCEACDLAGLDGEAILEDEFCKDKFDGNIHDVTINKICIRGHIILC